MASVDDGRDLYRGRLGAPPDPAADRTASPGTVGRGRTLYRANHGDEDARAAVRRWAQRGDQTAAQVLDGAGTDGMHITEHPGAPLVGDGKGLVGGDAA